MYKAIEISPALKPQLVKFKLEDDYPTAFDLKGFDYLWIKNAYPWQDSSRVMDVGSGYSLFPVYLADNYGCETWAVDDFGLSSNDEFWDRNLDHQKHIQKYPQVKFALERLGNPQDSTLPEGYFDCIYSASALEHVPNRIAADVWKHMDQLLKPGGHLIHAVDMIVPTHRGIVSLAKGALLDTFRHILPESILTSNCYYAPKCYLSLVSRALQSKITSKNAGIGLPGLVINPEILHEPPEWVYNRIVKDNLTNVPHYHVISFLIHLQKLNRNQNQSQ